MQSEQAIEFGQEAIMTCLTLVAPILIVGIVIAILMGILQAMTQIQDQTVSFVPKIILIAVTFLVCLPWLTERMVDYSHDLFAKPMFVNQYRVEPEQDQPVTVSTTDQVARVNSGGSDFSLR